MDWTLTYMISQILIIVVYIFLCLTYFFKDRKKILFFNIIAHFIQIISFLLLNGLTGAAMNVVYIARDSVLALDEKNMKESNKITKRDVVILLVFIVMIIVLTIFTYNGFSSLLSVVATTISTFAIWQKNTKIYKILGIPVSIAWLGYYISLKSIFAIILESILLISTIIGYNMELIKSKKNNVK